MKRQVFLIPGFFGFANLGDFAYWGPVLHKLQQLFDDAGMPADIHCVKSLPTASLRARTRFLLETIARVRPRANIPRAVVPLIAGISLLDAKLVAQAGHPVLAVAAIAGFAATLAGQRYVRGT